MIKKFDTFWLGYYLCDLLTKSLRITPQCFLGLHLKLYDLAKKIRDRGEE